MSRTTIYLNKDVSSIINRVVQDPAQSNRGRSRPGRMTTSGFIRFALTSWDEIISGVDHGLNSRELSFVSSIITPYMRGDGEMPFNPVLSARVGAAKSSLIAHGVDSRELSLRLEQLDVPRQCKLFVDINLLQNNLLQNQSG